MKTKLEQKNMIKYNSLAECEAVINTLKTLGREVPEWIIEQRNLLENDYSIKSVYETLRRHSKFPYSDELVECITNTVNNLLVDTPNANAPGLLLGKIQCGKTNAFENIIGVSFDKGIDVSVVLTKGTNTLAYQTIERLRYDFRHFKETDQLDQQLVVEVDDIKDLHKRGGLSANQVNRKGAKRIIVCMKQADNMQHLIELFKEDSPALLKKKVLIVDDEADFASRNYRIRNAETTLAKISSQIEKFCSLLEYYRYLQVTATPYSLYLQPDGYVQLENGKATPFKPRFTTLLPIHDKYVGGQQYFVEARNPESLYCHLFHPIKTKCIEVLGRKNEKYLNNNIKSKNIEDLRYVIVGYFMSTAVRMIQERRNGRSYRSSAVFHVMIQKNKHQWQGDLIKRFIEEIHKVFLEGYRDDARICPVVDAIYDNFQESNQNGHKEGLINVELPAKEEIIAVLTKILDDGDYNVRLVNSNNDVKVLLNEDGQLKLEQSANIFIGGNILDRGITISNMLCFFYGRTPRTFQQDAVLQHARMFGARDKEDMAVSMFHTSNLIYGIMSRMNELDEQLRQSFVGSSDKSVHFVFVGLDNRIKPCSSQKIKVSNTLVIRPNLRILPIGFQTGPKSTIGKTIQEIRRSIENLPSYAHRDTNGFFEINKDLAIDIVKKIRSTYIYDREIDNNKGLEWEVNDMIGCIEYATQKTNGKLYCLHRTNRNMKRIGQDGAFIDIPEDGRTDLQPARERCTTMPVLMLFQENGTEEQGWRGTPFYWPSLYLQNEVDSVIYTVSERTEYRLVKKTDVSELIYGINPDEILELTLSDDNEFLEIMNEEQEAYECTITEGTALRYLKSENGVLVLNNSVVSSRGRRTISVYSRNNDVFPYYLKQYRYILFNKSRDKDSDAMLVHLDEEAPTSISFNEEQEGDVLQTAKGADLDSIYRNMGLWVVQYNIDSVVGVVENGDNDG